MKLTTVLRTAALVLAAAALLTIMTGCSDDKESGTAGTPVTEEQAVPDIFIDDGAGLGNQDTPPALVIETTKGETVSAVNATLGGYVWRWLDESGKEKLSEEEAPCAADMKEITVIRRSSAEGKAKLQISGGTLHLVKVWEDGKPMEESEKVTVENNTIVFPPSGAWRYEIVVDYEGGRVYYAFMVSE